MQLLLGISSVAMGAGQSGTAAAWNSVTTIDVRPDRVRMFEGLTKKLAGEYRREGVSSFHTYETLAGNLSEYTMVVPVKRFADLDPGSGVDGRAREGRSEELWRRIARCSVAQRRRYETPQNDVAIAANGPGLSGYWVETEIAVAPGRLEEYLQWLREDYRPALVQAGVAGFTMARPIFGSAAGQVVTYRRLRNLAEIDGGAVLNRALSNEQVRTISAKSVPLISSARSAILRMRADLSY